MKPIYIILIFIISTSSLKSLAQEFTHINDTCIQTTKSEYDKLLQYFIHDKTKIRKLYKLDLFQLALGRINFAMEQEISSNHSIEFSFEAYQMKSSENTKSSYLNKNNYNIQYLSIEADYRYYHNTNNRLRKGKNTNGFSANYLTIGLGSHFWFYNEDVYYMDDYAKLIYPNERSVSHTGDKEKFIGETNKYRPKNNLLVLKPGYGIQRRIGNIGYFDVQVKYGIGTNYSFSRFYIIPELNVKAGFAISSFKKNK